MELHAQNRLGALRARARQPQLRATAPRAGTESFLPDRLVMLDCEMTGLDPRKDDLIQVAALKLRLQNFQYVPEPNVPHFNLFIHTTRQPESEFARKHMTDVYRRANNSLYDYISGGRMLAQWLGSWRSKVSPAGDCVPTDVLFMWEKGMIELSRYDGDTPVPGTFHYEYFDMNPIKALARQKMGCKFDKELPKLPGEHDALVDCLNQAAELNAFIAVLLGLDSWPQEQAEDRSQPVPNQGAGR